MVVRKFVRLRTRCGYFAVLHEYVVGGNIPVLVSLNTLKKFQKKSRSLGGFVKDWNLFEDVSAPPPALSEPFISWSTHGICGLSGVSKSTLW